MSFTLIVQAIAAIPKLVDRIERLIAFFDRWEKQQWKQKSDEVFDELEKSDRTSEEVKKSARDLRDLIRNM